MMLTAFFSKQYSMSKSVRTSLNIMKESITFTRTHFSVTVDILAEIYQVKYVKYVHYRATQVLIT